MVKTLEQALAEVAALPDADQEQIGRGLLSHVEKLRPLLEELDKGARSLDAGKGRTFSIYNGQRRRRHHTVHTELELAAMSVFPERALLQPARLLIRSDVFRKTPDYRNLQKTSLLQMNVLVPEPQAKT
jgi:hypothetical protein